VSDLELLFLVLALVYCIECAWWLRRGTVGFRTWLGRRWGLANPSAIAGNQRGGFIITNPLPPLGAFLTASQLPVSLSPEVVLVFVAASVNPGSRPPQTGRLIRFEDMQKIESAGRAVRVNGELLLKAGSPGLARELVKELQRLSKAPVPSRAGIIKQMVHRAMDMTAIERLRKEHQQQSRGVKLLANALFCYLFIGIPVVIWNFGLLPFWLELLLGVYAFTLTIALRFRRAHKKLYPEAADELFSHFLQVLLWPVTAMRAHDFLSRPLLESFHPLAVARTVCPPDRFKQFAARVLLELRHPALPVCPSTDTRAQAAELETRSLWEGEVEKFLKREGIDPDTLLRPPETVEEGCLSYCPRCRAQFTTATGRCEDCGGVELLTFAPAPRSRK
jgi:hypothetical protein